MRVSLNWLKDYVQVKASPQILADQLTMAGLEVKKIEAAGSDTIFETEITSNRPDWLSHLGVALEIHAVTGSAFKIPATSVPKSPQCEKHFVVTLSDRDLCPYYSAVFLEGIEWGKTPDFLKARLETCGIRSINLIVDITNYVLLEWGQPLHAFDADRLHGNEIFARRAQKGENITAIDGTVYELSKDDLIIADGRGPIAIGGVMCGKNSEVNTNTKNVLLESAFFTPSSVRATARRLVLGSESSYRFELRVDPRGVDQARDRALYLIAQHSKIGKISRVFRAGKLPIKEPKILLPQSEIKRILGADIPGTKAKTFLSRLGLKISGTGKTITASIPSFRSDLMRPVDLIEEVARLYGYGRIPETLPSMIPLEPHVDPILEFENEIRQLLVSLGFYEAINFSLVDPKPFDQLGLYKEERTRLINPQNKELNLMRPSLLSGLLLSVRRNASVGETEIRLFEVGNRYLQKSNQFPHEERMAAFILSGESGGSWLQKKRPFGFYDLKGFVEMLLARIGRIESWEVKPSHEVMFQKNQGFVLETQGKEIGFYGTLSDDVRRIYDVEKPVFYAEFSLEKVLALLKTRKLMKEIQKFPPSPRDLTLILDEPLNAETIIERIREMGGELASKIEVFDYFKGGQIPKGKKSLSFRIFYQAKDRTLQNEEVNRLHFSIIESLNQLFGAELPKGKE